MLGVDEDLLDDPKILKSESLSPLRLSQDDMSIHSDLCRSTTFRRHHRPSCAFPWTLTDPEVDIFAPSSPIYPLLDVMTLKTLTIL
jgi:hypothetical protein